MGTGQLLAVRRLFAEQGLAIRSIFLFCEKGCPEKSRRRFAAVSPCLPGGSTSVDTGHCVQLYSPRNWPPMIPVPTYAIDDQTAIKVNDGTVEIVSEGHWKLFTP